MYFHGILYHQLYNLDKLILSFFYAINRNMHKSISDGGGSDRLRRSKLHTLRVGSSLSSSLINLYFYIHFFYTNWLFFLIDIQIICYFKFCKFLIIITFFFNHTMPVLESC